MFYAIQIGNDIFTCSTTGQQWRLLQAAQAIGAKAFFREHPYKANHAAFADYDSEQTLQAFLRSVTNPDPFDKPKDWDGSKPLQ